MPWASESVLRATRGNPKRRWTDWCSKTSSIRRRLVSDGLRKATRWAMSTWSANSWRLPWAGRRCSSASHVSNGCTTLSPTSGFSYPGTRSAWRSVCRFLQRTRATYLIVRERARSRQVSLRHMENAENPGPHWRERRTLHHPHRSPPHPTSRVRVPLLLSSVFVEAHSTARSVGSADPTYTVGGRHGVIAPAVRCAREDGRPGRRPLHWL